MNKLGQTIANTESRCVQVIRKFDLLKSATTRQIPIYRLTICFLIGYLSY